MNNTSKKSSWEKPQIFDVQNSRDGVLDCLSGGKPNPDGSCTNGPSPGVPPCNNGSLFN